MNLSARTRGLGKLVTAALAAVTGCNAPHGEAEKFGKTFYLDGAGNWGFGAAEVPEGLKEAGYEGDVEIYVWTTSFNPLIDQLNTPLARLRGAALSDRIKEYRTRFPDRALNIIALSAGTGVAVWAVEGLDDKSRINNLILLGSSLSHTYDVRAALKNMTGKVYAYYSATDQVLEGVTLIGTIDGQRGVSSVGLVGLTPPKGLEKLIVNIPWDRKFVRYGWTGAHTDCTSKPFVREVLAKHILDLPAAEWTNQRRAASAEPAAADRSGT